LAQRAPSPAAVLGSPAHRRAPPPARPPRRAKDADESKEFELKFKDIAEANEVLSDPEKRAAYDRGDDMEDMMRQEQQRQHAQHHGGGFHGFPGGFHHGGGFHQQFRWGG
jgi:DnaJ-class molecular chaperone